MSKPRTHSVSAAASSSGSTAFGEPWRSGSKACKTQDKNTTRQDAEAPPGTVCKELQSPQCRSYGRFYGQNHGDSPSDMEPSQDIIWDSTSPPKAGKDSRNVRSVEISDIVNRIAPKDVKPRGPQSPLWQWIGDSTTLTPEMPKPRVKKKSIRQNSVDDLMKLARKFDENMQQDKEASEQLNTNNNNNKSDTTQTQTSALNRTEAELHALFDSSTQGASGGFSPSSSRSSPSQEASSKAEASQSSKLKSAGTTVSVSKCDDFEDDWENDDLLNDSFILAMTQNPDSFKTPLASNTKQTVCQRTASKKPSEPARVPESKSSISTLEQLCPQVRTTNRRTFKLEPNPRFQTSTEGPPTSRNTSENKSATSKTIYTKITDKKQPCDAADSSKDILCDDWDDDDALFYQVCDTVEWLSKSQPEPEKPAEATARPTKTTSAPLPIDKTLPTNTNKSPRAFVRSNSLPEGWQSPVRGWTSRPGMSQSLPERQKSRNSSGSHVDVKTCTVTAGVQPSNAAFKRSVCDSAVKSNKVFVTNQMARKCSAAEIERKKQEALARRRQRMQDIQKP
uniref:ewing's tumor-associated antigen 1 homolog n=1 Tax=Doryrhamphus excisus TaxID=161450 RepID=UPI0025AE8299|nr:ewing's tumor-associated antigen 1 homolog [Doryrhamphus excisus]